MPYQPLGQFVSHQGFARKQDFKRPVTFFDRVRFVGAESTIEIFGGILTGSALTIQADLISGDWDGAVPLALPDGTATTGYALEFDTGIGQFTALYASGEHLEDIVASKITVGQLTTTQIEDLAINVDKIAANAVTVDKVGDLAIATGKLALDAVTAEQLADLAVGNEHIQALSITADEIAANTITAAQILANTITAAEIFANTITASEIAADTITASEIAAGTITATEILANTISATEILANTITASEIAAGTITIDRLILGSSDNLIKNPGAEAFSLQGWEAANGGGTWTATTIAKRSGKYNFRYQTAGQTTDASLIASTDLNDINAGVAAAEGDEFHFEGWVISQGSSPLHRTRLQILWKDFDGATISFDESAGTTATASYVRRSVEGVAPAGTAYAVFVCKVHDDGSTSNHRVHWDDFYARRKVGTLIIEGQAVDIERMLDPVDAVAEYDFGTTGTKAYVTWNTGATTTYTVPSWAGEVTYIATAMGSMLGSITTQGYFAVRVYNGSTAVGDEGVRNIRTDASHKGATCDSSFSETLTSPGSTVTTKAKGYHFFGSTSRNMQLRLSTTYIAIR